MERSFEVQTSRIKANFTKQIRDASFHKSSKTRTNKKAPLILMIEKLSIFQVLNHQTGFPIQLFHLPKLQRVLNRFQMPFQQFNIFLQLRYIVIQLFIVDAAEPFHLFFDADPSSYR